MCLFFWSSSRGATLQHYKNAIGLVEACGATLIMMSQGQHRYGNISPCVLYTYSRQLSDQHYLDIIAKSCWLRGHLVYISKQFG